MIASSWSIYSVLTPLFKRIRTAEFTSSEGPGWRLKSASPCHFLSVISIPIDSSSKPHVLKGV